MKQESRPLPRDLDAEAVVLSSAFDDQDALDRVLEVLKPVQFFSEANRQIYATAVELVAAGKPVDRVTVAGTLRDRDRLAQVGGAAYLAMLAENTPAVAHVETYANRVREKWRLRELISACTRIAAEGYGDVGDVQVFVDRAEQLIFDIARQDEQRHAASMGEVMRESHRRMLANEARGAGAVELPTGLDALDRKMGGLSRGCVTVLAARPGMGKTALAMAVAESVATSAGPVSVFSLEMPRAELGMRMACAKAGANVKRGIKGILYPDERANVLRAQDILSKLPIWIDDRPALSLMQIRAKARSIAAEAKSRLALIVIDYLQLMRGRRDGSREQELSEITRGVKELSKDMGCAVVLLSQLNRQCEEDRDKRPRLRHLRETGSIEQDADDVVFVYRDDYYDPATEAKGVAELIVAKQRNGPTGTVKVAYYGRSTSFDNLMNEQSATEAEGED